MAAATKTKMLASIVDILEIELAVVEAGLQALRKQLECLLTVLGFAFA